MHYYADFFRILLVFKEMCINSHMKETPYKCIRCGYTTNHKTSISLHFQRKKPCAANTNIVLTDDIKRTILENRIYHLPKEPIQMSIANIKNLTLNIPTAETIAISRPHLDLNHNVSTSDIYTHVVDDNILDDESAINGYIYLL